MLIPSLIRKLIALLTLLCTFAFNAQAAEPITLLNDNSSIPAGTKAEFLSDPEQNLTLEQVMSEAYSRQFQAAPNPTLNFGRTLVRQAVWVRFEVVNQSERQWYLLLDALLSSQFELYILPSGNNASEAAALTATYAKPLSGYRRPAWSLDLPQGEVFQVYLRAANHDSILQLPADFVQADVMVMRSSKTYRLLTAIYAGMLVLAVYHLLMAGLLRDLSYAFLGVHVAAMAATIHRTNPVFDGLDFLSNTHSYFFTLPLLVLLVSFVLFTRLLLNTHKNTPWVDKALLGLVLIGIVQMVVVGAIPGGTTWPLLLGMAVLMGTFITGLIMAFRSNRIARYFSSMMLFSVLAQSFNIIMIIFHPKLWSTYSDIWAAGSNLLFLLLMSLILAERVRMEREASKQIEATAKAKDQFIAVMNHELRTPMNAIAGLGHLLSLEKLPATQQTYVTRLNKATQHMMQLINNVLDFAKTEQPHFRLEEKPFQLDIALHSIHQLSLQQAEQKGLQLHLDNQTDKSLVVVGDRVRLAQVLNNLLTNAIRYTSDGTVTLRVSQNTDTAATPDAIITLTFSVQDTGSGIPAEQIKTLFEPFRQLNNQSGSPHREGVGLGLPISKQLVGYMGGTLRVNSQPDSGSEFYFEIDMPLADTADIIRSGQTELTTLRLTPGSHILLVDDSEANRFVGKEMLQNMGATVGQANSGKNAILQLQQNSYDLVLLDISMPDMDGLEVTRWIRQHSRTPHLPVIALTAHALGDMQKQCEAAGMNDFIGKPFEYQTLYQVLYQHLTVQRTNV